MIANMRAWKHPSFDRNAKNAGCLEVTFEQACRHHPLNSGIKFIRCGRARHHDGRRAGRSSQEARHRKGKVAPNLARLSLFGIRSSDASSRFIIRKLLDSARVNSKAWSIRVSGGSSLFYLPFSAPTRTFASHIPIAVKKSDIGD
jgi:hypothetical protein